MIKTKTQTGSTSLMTSPSTCCYWPKLCQWVWSSCPLLNYS